MKINILRFAYFFCIYGVFTSVIVGAMDITFAQSTASNSNQSVLNGLYSPTASERFFEEGKKKIERETKILVNPQRYKPEGILKINIVNTKIIQELEENNPILNFPNDGLQALSNIKSGSIGLGYKTLLERTERRGRRKKRSDVVLD